MFVTAVTSSLERLKPSLRTVFPSELVLAPIPDSQVDQHLADILSDHNNHERVTYITEYNPASTPPLSSSSSYCLDYEGGLKDAVKVLISYMYSGIHFTHKSPCTTSFHPFHSFLLVILPSTTYYFLSYPFFTRIRVPCLIWFLSLLDASPSDQFFQISVPQTAAGLSVEGGMGLSGALIRAVFDEVNALPVPSTSTSTPCFIYLYLHSLSHLPLPALPLSFSSTFTSTWTSTPCPICLYLYSLSHLPLSPVPVFSASTSTSFLIYHYICLVYHASMCATPSIC